ncbi:MAG: hypothetical protein PSU94_03265 [Lacunisphaera sp.]|nr:hypothetical protein [Lacunisphaera sp.]
MKTICHYIFVAAAFALTLPLACRAEAQDEGPVSIVQTYKVTPAHRPAFRTWLETQGSQQFAAWKKAGTIMDYLILLNPYIANDTSDDVMIVIDFPNFFATAAWRQIERKMPGGLPPEALKLATPQPTVLTDLLARFDDPSIDLAKAAFQITKFKAPSAAAYSHFVKHFTSPQFAALRDKAHVISGFRSYLNREQTSQSWDAIIIVQAPSWAALMSAESFKAGIRADLAAADPEFKKMMETRKTIRTETSITNLDAVIPSGP